MPQHYILKKFRKIEFKKVIVSILLNAGIVLQAIFNTLGDFLEWLTEALQKKKAYSAEFGNSSDISSRWNKGFLITRSGRLTRRKSFENVLLVGVTGSGKTTRLLLQNLYEFRKSSLVINDPSQELFLLSSGHLSKNFKIKTLNFSDSKVSSGYNILSRIKKPNDVHRISDLLVRTTISGNSGDPFWQLQSKSLLSILIRLVLYQPKEFQNMANVLHILNHFAANPQVVDKWVVETGDAKLLLDYKAMVSTPEKTLQNIVASAKAALQLFEDEEIQKVTSYDSIDFEALRKEPTVLFLHNAISEQKYFSILTGIFFEQLYGHILQKLPEKNGLDLFIILEEASSIYVPVLPVAISNTRKHRVGNLICVQSPGQLKANYDKDADNIVSNCVTKIFLPGQTAMETLREIETLSGKFIHKDKDGTERTRPLITADEIRLLDQDRSLILSGNNPIIKGRTSPYYRSLRYKSISKIPPVSLEGNIPETPIPLLTSNENPQ